MLGSNLTGSTVKRAARILIAVGVLAMSIIVPVNVAHAAPLASTSYGKSCVGAFEAEPTSMTANFPYKVQIRCIINPQNNSTGNGWMSMLASVPHSGTAPTGGSGGLNLAYSAVAPGSSAGGGGNAGSSTTMPYTFKHGRLLNGAGTVVEAATGGMTIDNMILLEMTNWQYGSGLSLGSWQMAFTDLGGGGVGLYLNQIPCFDTTDMNGGTQDCMTYGGVFGAIALNNDMASPWSTGVVQPNYFGATTPYNPTPCMGVNTTLVKNGTNVTEPITSATVAQGDVVQVRISFPDGTTPTQTARMDFIPDTSVPTGRRTLGTWPLPNSLADVLVNVTASFQAFDDETFTLSRTAVRCESEWGFGYDTFDGSNPWGATPIDASTPSADEDERTLSACLSGAGIGLNPSSWVPAAGRMFTCSMSVLFVPDGTVLQDAWEGLDTAAHEHVPVSWVADGLDLSRDLVDGMDSAVIANEGDCLQWLEDFGAPSDAACLDDALGTTTWPTIRIWLGRFVYFFFGLWVLSEAMAIVNGHRTPLTESYYIND